MIDCSIILPKFIPLFNDAGDFLRNFDNLIFSGSDMNGIKNEKKSKKQWENTKK